MPFCENCGTKLSDTAKFCPNCGHKAGDSASVSGQDNPVTPAPSDQPSKYEIVGYLAAYAKELLSLQKAVRRLFPSFIHDYEPTVRFEGESLVLRGDPKDRSRSLHKVLFDWSTLRLDRYEIPKLKYCSLQELPEVLKRTWQSCFDTKDPGAIGAFQRKVKDVFAAIGDWSKIYDSSDIDATRNYRYPKGLDELRDASLLEPSVFSNVIKKESRRFAEMLWGFWDEIFHLQPKRWLRKPFFLYFGKWERLSEDQSLTSALREALAFFPGENEFASYLLPAACDAIEGMAEALNESFSKRFYLPPQYRSPECAVGLARLLLDGKADTWKEAMVLFDTEKYRETVIQGLGNISGQIALLNQQVKGLGAQTSAILGELKTANIKLSSIATSTFITAVFGDD